MAEVELMARAIITQDGWVTFAKLPEPPDIAAGDIDAEEQNAALRRAALRDVLRSLSERRQAPVRWVHVSLVDDWGQRRDAYKPLAELTVDDFAQVVADRRSRIAEIEQDIAGIVELAKAQHGPQVGDLLEF